jgi:glucodextranase-like protein/Big-like domain-containing protein
VAYDFRSAESVHVLLSAGAASDYIGPGYGWTAAGEQLFLNALAWAREVEQMAPSAPTLDSDDELVAQSPATLTGTAEFRSTVTILRNGEPVGEAEPDRDGSFSAEVELIEGSNVFTATAANYAGSSPASEPVTVTLDTTGPLVTWTPTDRAGFFEARLVVSGTATDPGAGVGEVLVNGAGASLTADGNFAAEVQLAEGENEINLVARDRLGNETSETRRVAFFRYSAAWSVVGEKGKGILTAFLDLKNAAGTPIRVDSAVAELVRVDGTVQVSEAMRYEDGRYKAKLGDPPAGTYALRGILVVSGWNVRLTGPTVIRAGGKVGAADAPP